MIDSPARDRNDSRFQNPAECGRLHGVIISAAVDLLCGNAVNGKTLPVRPGTELSTVRDKLAENRDITEVVFEEGTYGGGLQIDAVKAADGGSAVAADPGRRRGEGDL